MKITIARQSDEFDTVATVLNNRSVGTFITPESYNSIIKSHRLNTLDELGDSRTNQRDSEATRKIRKEQEERFLFGKDSLYGMLVNKKAIENEFNSNNPDYGHICLIWKDSVKQKSIAFLGDSVRSSNVTGKPTLSLYETTGKYVQHWLAQYKVYNGNATGYMDREKGWVSKKIELSKFDVDVHSMRQSIGKGFNIIEVIHKGSLHFPNDFKMVVVKEQSWIKPIKSHLAKFHSDCEVITASEYSEI